MLFFFWSKGDILLPTHHTYKSGGLNTHRAHINIGTSKTTTKEKPNLKDERYTEKHTKKPSNTDKGLPPINVGHG